MEIRRKGEQKVGGKKKKTSSVFVTLDEESPGL